MFSAVPMRRLRMVVLARDERAVLRGLGRLGAVHLARGAPGPDTAPLEPADCRADLARCNRILARTEQLRRAIAVAPPAAIRIGDASDSTPARERGRPARFLRYLRPDCGRDARAPAASRATMRMAAPPPPEGDWERIEAHLAGMEAQAAGILERRQRLLQRRDELKATDGHLADYRGFGLPLDPLDRASFLHFVVGSLPEAANLAALQQAAGGGVVLVALPAKGGRQPLVAMTTRPRRAELEEALRGANFRAGALPEIEGGTVDGLALRNTRETARVDAELAELDAALQGLTSGATDALAEMEERARTERQLLEARQTFPRTETAVQIGGWIPHAETAALERSLLETTGGRCVIELAPPGDAPAEEIPVLLKHPRWLRPFARLVTAFGLPLYGEIEPTLFVAVSYVLMFGMMFGDAGQGALLALGGLWLLRAARSEPARDAGRLLLWGGGSSVVFGAVYGSCFGLASFKRYALWRDPLEGDPLALLLAGIGVGVVMISLGIVCNIVNRFRRGDRLGGWLDKFGAAGLLFYWGALALVAARPAFEAHGLLRAAAILFLALPAAAWMLHGPIRHLRRPRGSAAPGGESLGMVLAESAVEAFEGALLYLANTISFVRLAAYAMSHGALMMAVGMMAAMAAAQMSAGGRATAVAILVLGNVVAIVLEGIIASVQALRLEYYEFFGKFYSGGGRPFQPFCLEGNAR